MYYLSEKSLLPFSLVSLSYWFQGYPELPAMMDIFRKCAQSNTAAKPHMATEQLKCAYFD